MAEADLILVLLSLVDMTLVGGLLVMVMFSGYENFVSQLDIAEHKEKLNWLGKMDASSLKNKVAASIVAISSIHLLRVFMDAKNVPDNKLMWYVIIHLTFVLSAFVMGYLDTRSVRNKFTMPLTLPSPQRGEGIMFRSPLWARGLGREGRKHRTALFIYPTTPATNSAHHPQRAGQSASVHLR